MILNHTLVQKRQPAALISFATKGPTEGCLSRLLIEAEKMGAVGLQTRGFGC